MASEFLVVAEHVLSLREKPMRPAEIVDVAFEHGLFSDRVSGKTPEQTMKSKLSQDVRRHGSESKFVRTAPGRFYLRRLLDNQHQAFEAPRHAKPASREKVLVIRQKHFSEIVGFQGLHVRWKLAKKRLLRDHVCEYIDRREAEESEEFKQALTYVAITKDDKLLCYKRGSYNRVEKYLRGSRCVGFGGHVIKDDRSPLFPSEDFGITECVIRELCEELELPPADRTRLQEGVGLECIGIINDDSSPVGRKHFAFVFRYEVSGDHSWEDPRRGEKSITQLQWLDDKIRQVPIWEFEYWSQLVLRRFFPRLISKRQSYKLVRRKPLQPPHILCVVGEVGSGKSTTTRLLCDSYAYEEINTGRLVAEILGIPPVPDTRREEFQRQAFEFISSDTGPETLALRIAEKASVIASGRALVDGVRQIATLEQLRAKVGKQRMGLLYVYTPPDMAFNFFRDREQKGVTFDEYLKIRNADVEREVPEMLRKADGVIYNWTGSSFLVNTVRTMMKELGINRGAK